MFVGAYAVECTKRQSKGQWNIGDAVDRARWAAMSDLGDHPGCIYPIPWADELEPFKSARNEI